MLTLALVLTIIGSLTGGTVAWFTDTVESTNNVIESGKLDMVVEYKTSLDGEWAALEENTKLFKENALYEPGYTEIVFLRVKNAGNLAFKYNLALSVVDSMVGTSVLGNQINLSEYLQMGAVTLTEKTLGISWDSDAIAGTHFSSRDKAIAYVSNPNVDSCSGMIDLKTKNEENLVTLSQASVMLPGEENNQVIALVLTMPTTVGNEANHIGNEAPQINLGLHVVATQHTHESDSFGSDYDADATYPGIENSDAPKANVIPLPEDKMPTAINYNWSPVQDDDYKPQTLDVAYQFSATESQDEAAAGKYGKWHADFVVYADKDVPEKSIALAGQYATWDWLGFANHVEVKANEQVRLLYDAANLYINYEEICGFQTFSCGATAIDKEDLAGTTLTVELRLYEVEEPSEANGNSWNVETGDYIIVSSYTHKF